MLQALEIEGNSHSANFSITPTTTWKTTTKDARVCCRVSAPALHIPRRKLTQAHTTSPHTSRGSPPPLPPRLGPLALHMHRRHPGELREQPEPPKRLRRGQPSPSTGVKATALLGLALRWRASEEETRQRSAPVTCFRPVLVAAMAVTAAAALSLVESRCSSVMVVEGLLLLALEARARRSG